LDELDVGILRSLVYPGGLQWNVRPSLSAIGRAVGLDADTVGRRLARLESAGVLQGFDVLPNPSLFDCALVRINTAVSADRPKEAVLDELGQLDGAYWTIDHWGRHVGLAAFCRSGPPVQRLVRVVAGLSGGAAHAFEFPFPAATVAPTQLDWRLLRELRARAGASLDDLAWRLRTSERTLRRRLAALTEGRCFQLRVRLDFGKFAGQIPTEVHVEYAHRDEAVDRLLAEHPGRLLFVRALESTHAGVAFGSLGEARALADEIGRRDGVRRVDLQLPLARRTHEAWLDEQVDRRC